MSPSDSSCLPVLVENLVHKTIQMTSHLNTHLLKEETECMPLISQTLTQSEMTELVGDIMGTRSSAQMKEIMTLAVNELRKDEQEVRTSNADTPVLNVATANNLPNSCSSLRSSLSLCRRRRW